ncbi:MAG TPA: alpha/beta fold hydrolase [Leptolyngbyaceae cyanobacterium M33_DOE_097]|uniref:Alpha/beta fold hydrolase n=1 Tax=Oscillatoriales cyanobacterium SpSt-418 TaxID=2282169 RepID=A0A7C3PBP8_9CYAN|nr:alpha/beta fold hydrolase [Leptolyngbyaceae cyanobacterium M33_DOE_097]
MTPVTPTAAQIDQTKQAIAAYIHSIDSHPERREGAYPYYLFHEPGQTIRGTVMIFHGFSAKPHQMWRLADYLFRNGFNVYQPAIAGHSFINPAKNWPQVDLKPEIAQPLKAKAMKDPVLQNYLSNVANSSSGFSHPNAIQRTAIVARLLRLEPRLLDIIKAIQTPDDPKFDTYFDSTHREFLTHAEARLNELAALPGDVYTVGLSVGGAVAIGLAAARPDRVKKVVAYAPLLQIHGEDNLLYVNLAGPLDLKESGWDPNLQFPVGCLTAANRFGSSDVMSQSSIQSLHNTPTFLVLTANEDAADIGTSQRFFDRIGGSARGHHSYFYEKDMLVPHPMVDPTEVSQNMSNRYWKSLYQETLRFLTVGSVDASNLNSYEENADMPSVPSV